MSKLHDHHMSDHPQLPRGRRDGSDTAGLGKQLDRLTKAIERQNQAMGKGGRGGGPGAGPVKPGGVSGAAGLAGLASIGFLGGLATGGAGLALGAAGTAAGLAGNIGGAGLTSQMRGGSFTGGALRQANKLASGIPVLGEGLGFAQTARTQEGALADLNRATGTVDKLAGPNAITPKIRQALAETFAAQARNLQEGRRKNKALVDDTTQGEVVGNLVGSMLKLVETVKELDDVFSMIGKLANIAL